MSGTRLTKFEIQIMETLWNRGEASIREMQEAFPEKKRPGYTTVQKTVYRMEEKEVVRRVRKVGNFHMFAAVVSRDAAQRRLVDDLLAMFGGQSRPVQGRKNPGPAAARALRDRMRRAAPLDGLP